MGGVLDALKSESTDATKALTSFQSSEMGGIELTRGVIFLQNVRDHRWLPVARFLLRSEATRRKRDAGSHSVDRIVSFFPAIAIPTH